MAGFVTALKDIDGVTRVGVQSSELASKGSESGSGGGGGEDCRTRDFIAEFSLVVAFDAAPVAATGSGAAEAPPEAAPEAAQAASSETSQSSGEGAEG